MNEETGKDGTLAFIANGEKKTERTYGEKGDDR